MIQKGKLKKQQPSALWLSGRFSSLFSFCGLYLRERWVLITSLSLFPLTAVHLGQYFCWETNLQLQQLNTFLRGRKKKKKKLLQYEKKFHVSSMFRKAGACMFYWTCLQRWRAWWDWSLRERNTWENSLYSWFSHEQTGFMTYQIKSHCSKPVTYRIDNLSHSTTKFKKPGR